MVNITTLTFHGRSSSLFLIFVTFFLLNMNVSTLFHIYIMKRVNIILNLFRMSTQTADSIIKYKLLPVISNAANYPIRIDGQIFLSNHE